MDFSKFKTPDWLMIGGGVGIFVFGFLKWVTVSFEGVDLGGGGNVFDFFWTGTIPWILLIASAVVTVLLIQGTLKQDQLPWPLVLLAATVLASLLLLIRLIFNPIEGSGGAFGGEIGRGIGMILSVISGLVATAGAFLNFQASGGDIKDLTDVDKLKASFSKSSGDDTPPPPPPPAPPAPPAPPTPPPPPTPPAPAPPAPPAPPAG